MRSVNVFLHSDFLYMLSKYARMERKALKIIHGTTNDVIRTRKAEFKNNKNVPTFSIDEDKDISKLISHFLSNLKILFFKNK